MPCIFNIQYMKAKKSGGAERSAVSGKLMKKKVKKSSKDKEVNIRIQCHNLSIIIIYYYDNFTA